MKISNTVKVLLVAVSLAMAGLLASAGAALAQEPDPSSETGDPTALEIHYKEANLAVQMFQLRIDMANHISDRVQTLIDKANGEGKDTSALVTALSAFKAQIGAAQTAHDSAAATLSTHAGFDDSGKVTDANTARTTLQSVWETLRNGHQNFREGVREFRRAFREWRKANQPQGQPAAP